MKEFDLEEAKKGAVIITKGGRPLRDVIITEDTIYGGLDIDDLRYTFAWSLNGQLCIPIEGINAENMNLMLMDMDTNPEEIHKDSNAVDHPSHYNQGNIECIDAMVAAYGMNEVSVFCRLNAFKYLWRAEHKANVRQDLEKARWYLDKALQLMEE